MGLQDTAVEVAIGAVVVVVGARALQNIKINLNVGGVPDPSKIPIQLPGGGYGLGLPGSFKDLSTLNMDIDTWFANANGLFGLGLVGKYDPTDWGAFTAKMTINPSALLFITYDPKTFPTYQTGYFSAKVAQFQNRGINQPGGLGT